MAKCPPSLPLPLSLSLPSLFHAALWMRRLYFLPASYIMRFPRMDSVSMHQITLYVWLPCWPGEVGYLCVHIVYCCCKRGGWHNYQEIFITISINIKGVWCYTVVVPVITNQLHLAYMVASCHCVYWMVKLRLFQIFPLHHVRALREYLVFFSTFIRMITSTLWLFFREVWDSKFIGIKFDG